jgi:peptide/nickel transport system permease protein
MRRLLGIVVRVAALAVLGALASALLVRYAPGFGLAEERLDARLTQEGVERREQARAGAAGALAYLRGSLGRWARGDLGESELFRRPVNELIGERAGPTLTGVGAGLGLAWLAALALVVAGLRWRSPWLRAGTHASTGLLQCLPAAALGLALLASGARGAWLLACGIALAVAPRLYRIAFEIAREAAGAGHVRQARALGCGRWRLILIHILPTAAAPLLALGGVSAAMGLSAAIPLEMVLDVPGLGQLAWQAALARDLNLLVALVVILGAGITAANAWGERA